MESRPLTWQELEYLKALHVQVDEHERKRTMRVAEFTKVFHRYMQLRRRFEEYGAAKNAA